ncbi:MAG: hypothetical protein AVDCRST_MAG77-484 [uncultured Chloroflexi bacterium]|uniref:Uncharacterized protein n=1 Tax=uncultured Chloroflexota bacterium TaxID=166587 RepID=A0A6J4HD67_9CHLR|nr:MAG: hypothetical protein AVDCRST_MAG77-484 [uncultured Chloroflexota bacterium]
MNTDPAERQLIDAETKLARALQRLSALRRAALYGSYDAAEFDQAVMAYRAAEADVLEARKTWAQRKEAGAVSTATAPSAPEAPIEDEKVEPLEITPRLLFAKWLVETGRLTDWQGAEASESAKPELVAAA